MNSEDFRQKDSIAHRVSEVVLVNTKTVYDSATTVLDVKEEAGHRRLRSSRVRESGRGNIVLEASCRGHPRLAVRAGPDS